MDDFYGGLKRRIREGAQKSHRDYSAEVEQSLDKAAIKVARSNLSQALVMVEAGGNPWEHVRAAQEALQGR